MKQNIYDHEEFFNGYKDMRDKKNGLNEVLEQPAIRALLPDVSGLRVLDLGCGMGQFCFELKDAGAVDVVGIDISRNMIELAEQANNGKADFHRTAIEDYEAAAESFDLIVSSLMLHYVENLEGIFSKIHTWLRPRGCFIFSMEHPVCTAAQGLQPGWVRDAEGNALYWPLDRYLDCGIRQSRWFVDGVIKYHRPISTILNTLIENGLSLSTILEPHALVEEEAKRPELLEERKRPPFLVIKAVRRSS